jgi:hypothetical protein
MNPPAEEMILNADSITTTEAARRVMWLSTNHRAMGDLFDEGFLNQKRLEWAVTNAYDKRIRQSAKILLSELLSKSQKQEEQPKFKSPPQLSQKSFQVDLSLEQARKMVWPFAPYKGQPIGFLVDGKQLSLKDLGYAIENAWDEKLRKAAIVLSLARLEQAIQESSEPAGALHIIRNPKNYYERQLDRLTLFEGALLGGMITILITLLLLSLGQGLPSPVKTSTEILAKPFGWAVLITIIVIYMVIGWLSFFIPNKIFERLDKKRENYRFGKDGEDRVEEVIRQSLDGDWYLFRNIILPGRYKGDIDAILVGSSGVWILEIKNFHGEYRNTGDQWECLKGKKWKSIRSNPSRQAVDNAARLGNFLKADGISLWVTPAVIWANADSSLVVENPATLVWPLDRLYDELGNLGSHQPVASEVVDRIVEKLTGLLKKDG